MARAGAKTAMRMLALALCCGALAAAAARGGRAGGAMSEASVTRLGDVRPGERGGEVQGEFVDPTPIVLWAGTRPAVVLYHRLAEDASAGTLVEELARVGSGVGDRLRALADAFPLTNRTRSASSPPEGEALDLYAVAYAIPADVNGDGVDELVAARQLGGVDVVGAKDVLHRFAGASGNRAVASYAPAGAQVARLGGRAVVHLLQRREVRGGPGRPRPEEVGAGDPYCLLRVDAAGVTRVVLRDLGFAPRAVLAVGAINPPGSAGVDELVVLSRKDEGPDVYVSRHRPDGSALAPARRIYVPFAAAAAWRAEFLPQSRVTVLHAPGRPELYFLEAEKPANWIRAVDLAPAVAGAPAQLVGVADPAANPKAVVHAGAALFAVDAAGVYHAAAGGALAPSPSPAPLARLDPPGPEFGPPLVVASATRRDEVLVAYTRPRTAKDLSHDELLAAARRFLPAEEVDEELRFLEPSLTDPDPVRDGLIAEERKRRKVDRELATAEDWKRALPDSYAASSKDRRDTVEARLLGQLLLPLRDPAMLSPADYRDVDAYRAWLAALDRPAETVLEVLRRGAKVRRVRVPGELGPFTATRVGRPRVDWRAGDAELSVVTTLSVPDERGYPAPAFYSVRVEGR